MVFLIWQYSQALAWRSSATAALFLPAKTNG
jgi:hypothetical protein